MFKKHGLKSVERCYVQTTYCPVCMIEFKNRERVLNHIRYRSEVCRENLLMGPPCITHEQADVLDLAEKDMIKSYLNKGHSRSYAEKSCVQMYGPFSDIVIDPDMESKHHPLGKGRHSLPKSV